MADRDHRNSRGFTLIEVMVALAVFSLAALALIRLEGATIRGAATIDETMMAQIVARNIAVETLTDAAPPVLGASNGSEVNGGRPWAWSRMTTPIGDPGALRVDIAVAGPRGATIGRLTIVRPPQSANSQ